MFSEKNTLSEKNFTVDYAILSAMKEELDFIASTFSECEYTEIQLSGIPFKIFDYRNNKVLVAYTGIGTAFAASIMTLVHSYFHPNYFLISGTAGGIKEGLRIGDVIIAEKAFEAELQAVFTAVKNTPFESCLTHPLKDELLPTHYSADPELLSLCDTLSFPDINLYKGTIVSSNAFPAPLELFEKIKRFNPYSIDMETSAFYQIAWLLNVKVLAVRGISNILNSDGSDDKVHESDVDGSSISAATVLLAVLNKSIQFRKDMSTTLLNTINEEASEVIEKFHLQQHPEGGYFAPSYKSEDIVKPADAERYNNENRSAGSSIYYMLNKDDYSAWHSLKSDELWHFYTGTPLHIHIIDASGNHITHLLGNPLKTDGATYQIQIKAGDYFAAENVDKLTYSLVGCTVSPGFEYSDFRLAEKSALLTAFPQHTLIIERLSHRSIESALDMIGNESDNSLLKKTSCS